MASKKGAGNSARSAPHLRKYQFKPGQSGNPKGRPRNLYQEAIEKALPPAEFAEIVTTAARDGDSRVISALMDRHFPKPEVAVKLEASGPDGGPIPVEAKSTLDGKLDALAKKLGGA